jgi:hypothetical protein
MLILFSAQILMCNQPKVSDVMRVLIDTTGSDTVKFVDRLKKKLEQPLVD